MFQIPTNAQLPPKAVAARAQRDAKQAVRSLTPAMGQALRMPQDVFCRVQRAWNRISADAQAGHHTFDDLALEGPLGVVLPYVKFDGLPHLGIVVMSHDSERQVGAVEHDCVDDKAADFVSRIWPVKPAGSLIADVKQQPNDRCACGSGRKYKKCCGR